jgi:hypothetical protein
MMQARAAAVARWARGIVVLAFAASATGGVSIGCGSCAAIALAGLNVTVVDGATGAPICDATVTAQDGTDVETLNAFASTPAAQCSYGGAYERPGTYTLTATAGSRSKVVTDVSVIGNGDDSCSHVATRKVTITLDP